DAAHDARGDLVLEPLLFRSRGPGGLRGLGRRRRRGRRLLLGTELVDQLLLLLQLLLHLFQLLAHRLELTPQLLALRAHAAWKHGDAERENGERHSHPYPYPSHVVLLPDPEHHEATTRTRRSPRGPWRLRT